MSDFLPFVLIGLTAGSVYGLAANGLVLTYKTSGIFNFSHGTLAALAAYAFYDLRERHGVPWPLDLLICLFVLAPLAGLVFERIARRLADAPVVMNVVATVGMLVVIQQAILIKFGAAAIEMPSFLPTSTFRVAGVNVGYDQLIIMIVGIATMLALTWMLNATRTGRSMAAVVDQPSLLALTGTSPVRVRRTAWMIGTAFAALSGILLAPSIGLDVTVLTLLVVQAFGAAAIGRFTSLPYTYLGGLIVGVLSAVSTKYVASVPWLSGVPSSLPFVILFVVLVVAPRGWLVDFSVSRKPITRPARHLPTVVNVVGAVAIAIVVWRLPAMVGARLPVFSAGLAYVLVFLSLALVLRTSGQVSLGQLAFAAVGAVASARLATEAGLPWLLAVLIGALFAVPVGALLAIPAIRRSGLYLALATFGFAVLLEQLTFSTGLMFGASETGSLPAPRPGFAKGDHAYFYVIAPFVAGGVALVIALHRSRLGRLLHAMADSAVALNTYGTSVTAIKVIVFCVSAFLAGLGGALLGPVTGSASPGNFESFESLMFLVVLSIAVGSEVVSSFIAAGALFILPVYISSNTFNEYLPLLFGVAAILVAMKPAELRLPASLGRTSMAARTGIGRHPALLRRMNRERVAS